MVSRRKALGVGAAAMVAFGSGEVAIAQDNNNDIEERVSKFLDKSAVIEADVHDVRSFDHHVYLHMTTNIHGYVSLHNDPFKFAIAAAASAAKRKVWVKYAGYNPNWGNGAGFFASVEFAFRKF